MPGFTHTSHPYPYWQYYKKCAGIIPKSSDRWACRQQHQVTSESGSEETPDTEATKQAQVENMVREAESEVSVNAPRDVEGAQ